MTRNSGKQRCVLTLGFTLFAHERCPAARRIGRTRVLSIRRPKRSVLWCMANNDRPRRSGTTLSPHADEYAHHSQREHTQRDYRGDQRHVFILKIICHNQKIPFGFGCAGPIGSPSSKPDVVSEKRLVPAIGPDGISVTIDRWGTNVEAET